MSFSGQTLGPLVIANGAQASSVIKVSGTCESARVVEILAPGTLTGVVTVQVSRDEGVTYGPYNNDAGVALTIAVNVAGRLYWPGLYTHIRVNSASAEGAARTFIVRALQEFD